MSHLENRIFTFRDLLVIMDTVGVGVGSTIHVVNDLDRQHQRPNTTFRKFDFPEPVDIDALKQYVASLSERQNS
jgi:hypothetical protein